MAAATAVFETAELFGEIFSYLTMEEVIRAQRVCRAWQSCIMASPELKRTLHFELQPGAIVPLLRRVKANHRKRPIVVFGPDQDPTKPSFPSFPILRFAPPIRVGTENRRRSNEWGFCKDAWDFLNVDVRDLLARTPGAWEEMRLTQPVLTSIEVEFSAVAALNSSDEDFWDSMDGRTVELRNPSGIRIRDLTDTVRSLMRDYELAAGGKVQMTSFLDAAFTLLNHVYEDSKDVRKAFRRNDDGEVMWTQSDWDKLSNLNLDDPFLDTADL